MSIDIICISNGSRPELLYQTLASAKDNASHWIDCSLTIVYDGIAPIIIPQIPGPTLIHNTRQQFASASRNIGAGSIPKYRRGGYVLFLDDDTYMCKGWDRAMLKLASPNAIISGYSHPFNRYDIETAFYGVPLVISSVCMMMSWQMFDRAGPWDEPGGRGASEDYALCCRARDNHNACFAVTKPQVCIHAGLRSNDGQEIVGYHELQNQNNALIKQYGLEGKVKMAL